MWNSVVIRTIAIDVQLISRGIHGTYVYDVDDALRE